MQYSPNIQRLEEIEQFLDEGTVIWEVDGKKVRAWNLWNHHGRVAVARSVIPAGTSFPFHVHEQVETLTCFDGTGVCIVSNHGGTEIHHPLHSGACIRLEKGQAHRIEAFTDLWVIAITVPAAEGFPD